MLFDIVFSSPWPEGTRGAVEETELVTAASRQQSAGTVQITQQVQVKVGQCAI